MVKKSLRLELRGNLSLKVLVAICSLSPPILRYSSQYLSKYDWGVSLLPMAIDKSASIGLWFSATSHKPGSKGLDELDKVVNGSLF